MFGKKGIRLKLLWFEMKNEVMSLPAPMVWLKQGHDWVH